MTNLSAGSQRVPFVISSDASTKHLLIRFSEEVRDDEWSRYAGAICHAVQAADWTLVTLDFRRTNWADPLPLLAICCVANQGAQLNLDRTVEVRLGSPRSVERTRFVTFFVTHGFARALGRSLRCEFRSSWYDLETVATLESHLIGSEPVLVFQNADCIGARVYTTDSLTANLPEVVEDIIQEADRRRVARWLTTPKQKGFLLHKLRVILTETLENVAEHAYPDQGSAAVYARVRFGAPETAQEFLRWNSAYSSERRRCPCLRRCNAGKQPGWLELFVCDVGRGITDDLISGTQNPLIRLANEMFRKPLSRHGDRAAIGKTGVTGLQHLGQVLGSYDQDESRGDFVRICCNGEWVGEHLPWPVSELRPDHSNPRAKPNSDPCPGTQYHFALEPIPPDGISRQKLYPGYFYVADFDDLSSVRAALGPLADKPREEQSRLQLVDLYLPDSSEAISRGEALMSWVRDLQSTTIVIRPIRASRKIDLISQLFMIATRAPVSVQHVIFADVPLSLAIDYGNILNAERLSVAWPPPNFRITIISQDWCCASFVLAADGLSFVPKIDDGRDLIRAGLNEIGAARTAVTLRLRDSQLFWKEAGDAYVNEPIVWKGGKKEETFEISGYLDLPLALFNRRCNPVARRALGRAIAAFAYDVVLPTDDLVRPLVEADFTTAEGSRALDIHGIPLTAVLAGGVSVTGATSARFRNRGDVVVRGSAVLLRHPDGQSAIADEIADVVALEWSPDVREVRKPENKYERISNSPFILRGGDRSIPLPRFGAPTKGKLGRSLYGDSPDAAYRRWQKLGVLRMGHWTHHLHHDLLSVNLLDALKFDWVDGGKIVPWITETIRRWKQEADRRHFKLIGVYPRHQVTDRLIRALVENLGDEAPPFFPMQLVTTSSISPLMVSPVGRERLGQHLVREFGAGGIVAHIDDVVLSGRTIDQIAQGIEGLWETLKSLNRVPAAAQLELRSIAILDRTGLPIQRGIVERRLKVNPRLWRWDVPALGMEASCPLCSVMDRCDEFLQQIAQPDLSSRLKQWLEVWQPVPVETNRTDRGLPARRLPKQEKTRICIEKSSEGGLVYHEINHAISTSRAAIAAELSRSTTRKDYPLQKAITGKFADGSEFDVQTRIEILAAQLLLFLGELTFLERVERANALLVLLWSTPEVSPATALAGLTSLADVQAVRMLWRTCCELVEQNGFPNQDCLITAFALLHLSHERLPSRPTHKDWTLLRLLAAGKQKRGALCRIFQVFGWDSDSIHRGLLLDLLNKPRWFPSDLHETLLMLDALREALEALEPEMVANIGLEPDQDAKYIAQAISELQSVVNAKRPRAAQPNNPADFMIALGAGDAAIQDRLRLLRSSIYANLFSTPPTASRPTSMQSRYKAALTTKLSATTPHGLLIGRALADLDERWEQFLERKKTEIIRRRWAAGRPNILCCTEAFPEKEFYVYQDAMVRRALTEIMSNVIHRNRPIICPWAGHEGYGEADMWVYVELGAEGASIDIQMANGVDETDGCAPLAQTRHTLHLLEIGGKVSTKVEAGVFFTTATIPTIVGLAWNSPE